LAETAEAGRLTATCGFGHQGQCCCECALLLVAKPRCHHIGGKGACGPRTTNNLVDRIVAEVEHAERVEEEGPTTYVCLAYSDQGIAQTDWNQHGCCEVWTARQDAPI